MQHPICVQFAKNRDISPFCTSVSIVHLVCNATPSHNMNSRISTRKHEQTTECTNPTAETKATLIKVQASVKSCNNLIFDMFSTLPRNHIHKLTWSPHQHHGTSEGLLMTSSHVAIQSRTRQYIISPGNQPHQIRWRRKTTMKRRKAGALQNAARRAAPATQKKNASGRARAALKRPRHIHARKQTPLRQSMSAEHVFFAHSLNHAPSNITWHPITSHHISTPTTWPHLMQPSNHTQYSTSSHPAINHTNRDGTTTSMQRPKARALKNTARRKAPATLSWSSLHPTRQPTASPEIMSLRHPASAEGSKYWSSTLYYT